MQRFLWSSRPRSLLNSLLLFRGAICRLLIWQSFADDGNAEKKFTSKQSFAQLRQFLVRIAQFWQSTLQLRQYKENLFQSKYRELDLLLYGRVVVKTANLVVSCCCCVDDGTEFF